MNERKVANLVIYNIMNVSIREIYKGHRNMFIKYKDTLKKIHSRIKTEYKSGSIKYYHDNHTVEFVNPFLMEKLGEDFNYWMVETNETIMSIVEPLVEYMDFVNYRNSTGNSAYREMIKTKRKVKNGKVIYVDSGVTLTEKDAILRTNYTEKSVYDNRTTNLQRLKHDLEVVHSNMKTTYQLEKDFLSQGPKINCSDEVKPYMLNEWFSALEYGVNNFDNIENNLEIMISTIDVLDKSIRDLKIKIDKYDEVHAINISYDNFMREELSEGDFLIMERKLLISIRTNVKKCLDYGLIRFGNYKKQCEYTLKNLELINNAN